MKNNDVGVLLTNVGTPAEPTPKAVFAYLREFLSDRRVVEIPRVIWWPILYGLILPFRSKSSAQLYQKIWTEDGSPLLINSQEICERLQEQLQIPVALGMHYGRPSISDALQKLRDVKKMIVLPLFPQYSQTTTAVSFDLVAKVLRDWRNLPSVEFVRGYETDENYIHAVADSVKKVWSERGQEHLLFSFHGIPERSAAKGDPYPQHCVATVKAITEHLKLNTNEWSLSFQSRLGRAKWLSPYTDAVLKKLPQQGVKKVHVISPGFAVDCLETLEEIAIRGRETFFEHGGSDFHYISALNAEEQHINFLSKIIKNTSS